MDFRRHQHQQAILTHQADMHLKRNEISFQIHSKYINVKNFFRQCASNYRTTILNSRKISYHGDGSEEYYLGDSHRQAIFDVRRYNNQQVRPNGDDELG